MTPTELRKVELNLQLTFDNPNIHVSAEMDEDGGHPVDVFDEEGNGLFVGTVERTETPPGYAFVMFITQEEIDEMGA